MNKKEARTLLARLHHSGQDFLSTRTLSALEVALKQLGGTPERSQPTVVGFVGVLSLPTIFYPGRGRGRGLLLPGPDEADVQQGWDRALAFRPLLLESSSSSGSSLTRLVQDLLDGKWTVKAPIGLGPVSMHSDRGDRLVLPPDKRLLDISTDCATFRSTWELAFGADESRLVSHLHPYAVAMGLPHSGALPVIDPKGKPVTINLSNIHERCYGLTPQVRSMADFHDWRHALGQQVFCELILEANPRCSEQHAELQWGDLSGSARDAWHRWLRSLPGVRRLELAIIGFFANGGAVACPTMAIQGSDGSHPVSKRVLLEEGYDHVPSLQRLCAPGLGSGWQQSILEYAHGRSLLPILETPRYLLSHPPRGIKVNEMRWMTEERGSNPHDFERRSLQLLDRTDYIEKSREFASSSFLSRSNPGGHLDYSAFGPWLIVDNPLSSGPRDRFVVAPPSGHVAACWDPDLGLTEPLSGFHARVVRPGQQVVERYSEAGIVLLPAA